MGECDENTLPDAVVPLPIRFRNTGYWTFNEGGKDDYNSTFEINQFLTSNAAEVDGDRGRW